LTRHLKHYEVFYCLSIIFLHGFYLDNSIKTPVIYSLSAIIAPLSNPLLIPNVSSKGKNAQNHPYFWIKIGKSRNHHSA